MASRISAHSPRLSLLFACAVLLGGCGKDNGASANRVEVEDKPDVVQPDVVQPEEEVQFRIEGDAVTIVVDANVDPLVEWAAGDLADDLGLLTGTKPQVVKSSTVPTDASRKILIGRFDDALIGAHGELEVADLKGEWETFSMQIVDDDLALVGSDVRGTVYAVFELAEELGVSPWKWWADVTPTKVDAIQVQFPGGRRVSGPSVQYRGVFLNDEGWGLAPWAKWNFEPEVGNIGPATYEKIFQLLLRLKANAIWPAMHYGTRAFFTVPGNQEMARKYHIVIGTSHAEPMLRNNVHEWDEATRGEFNYFTNQAKVDEYWTERIGDLDAEKDHFLVTMGMRGIHDSGMVGGATTQEKIAAIEAILTNQRDILTSELGVGIEKVPQAFIPYKEVLDLYNEGLKVPDDIALMWTDDNYGYIRRMSNAAEQARSGGGGVYYHLSYWGRPHDYLWLSSTQPGLIWFEMSRAWHNGAKRIWIANVGDIKPAEYDMEFFLDLAWDVNAISEQTVGDHLTAWAAREFGSDNAQAIAELMDEYYRLAFLRRPEFMGWSQTEPQTPTQPTEFNPLANGDELQRRIDAYTALYNQAEKLKANIPAERQAAYYELVEYPVKGAALLNHKFLFAHQAYLETDTAKKPALEAKVKAAYDEIDQLTDAYNALLDDKWKHMMNMMPRGLAAYKMPDYHLNSTPPAPSGNPPVGKPVFIQASENKEATGADDFSWAKVEGLGYSNAAMTLLPLTSHHFQNVKPSLSYEVDLPEAGSYTLEVRCLPTHSNEFDHALTVQVNQLPAQTFDLNTKGRSEEWKINTLRNYQSVKYSFKATAAGVHTLTLSVNQTGIVIDQLAVNPDTYVDYYEIPR